MNLRIAAGLAVLVLALAGTFLWLDARQDAAAPAGAGRAAAATREAPGVMAASDAPPAETGPAEAASPPLPAADARASKQPGSKLSGELAIEWSRAFARQMSDKIKGDRQLRAASGLIAGSDLPGHPDYDGSLGFATPAELQERFDAEPRDQEWARAAERQAERFLDSQRYRDAYGPWALECKATLCRFAAVGDAAVLSSAGLEANWQRFMHELLRDPAFAAIFSEQLGGVFTNNEHSGQLGFVTWLRRHRPPEG